MRAQHLPRSACARATTAGGMPARAAAESAALAPAAPRSRRNDGLPFLLDIAASMKRSFLAAKSRTAG